MNPRFCFLVIVILCVSLAKTGSATTITDLLDAVAKQPAVAVTELEIQESALNKQAVTDSLYPKFSLFGRGEMYNSPTNLRPMSPTEVNIAAGESIPFSRNILRYGLAVQMPVYTGKIYALRDKLDVLTQKAKVENRINLVTRQAGVVAINSSFQYLTNLDKAVSARIKSLERTRDDLRLKVKNGRSSEAELMKINNLLIELSQQENDLQSMVLDVQQNLNKLTDVKIFLPVSMEMDTPFENSTFIGVQKDELQVTAAQKQMAVAKAAYYPVVSLYGTLSGNDGEAYNTGDAIHRDYHSAGLVVSFPLFDKTLKTQKSIAGVQLAKARNQLDNTKIEVNAVFENLQQKLPIVERSLELAKQSVKNNEQLLKIAKVSFDLGRTTTEDYLDYESRVLAAQATLHNAMNAKWQIIAQLAILYGTDLRGIIK
ncbi:MAG: hypothetical protein DRH26_08935 [Deltaproteobacteria bacterium]|nr:MAG: hypothetical protein DRH26_08935 [Deltaproteobacteria bacterium]